MKLEVGKYYKTRDGRKVGPMVEDFEGDYMALHPDLGYLVTWMHDGVRWRHEPGIDIVSEWATPTTGTLAELDVKPGDVVALIEACLVSSGVLGLEATVDHDGHAVLKNGSYFDPAYDEEYGRKFRIVSRASDDKAGSAYNSERLYDAPPPPTGPVITEAVTTKRIVPGVYGKVKVNHHAGDMVQLQFQGSQLTSAVKFTRAELISARDILSQLIDAMAP